MSVSKIQAAERPVGDVFSDEFRFAIPRYQRPYAWTIEQDKIEHAIKQLEHLRTRVDGCGTEPDQNDWIVDCTAQVQVRTLIDLFIANLQAALPASVTTSADPTAASTAKAPKADKAAAPAPAKQEKVTPTRKEDPSAGKAKNDDKSAANDKSKDKSQKP